MMLSKCSKCGSFTSYTWEEWIEDNGAVSTYHWYTCQDGDCGHVSTVIMTTEKANTLIEPASLGERFGTN